MWQPNAGAATAETVYAYVYVDFLSALFWAGVLRLPSIMFLAGCCPTSVAGLRQVAEVAAGAGIAIIPQGWKLPLVFSVLWQNTDVQRWFGVAMTNLRLAMAIGLTDSDITIISPQGSQHGLEWSCCRLEHGR
jgi:hypothetical protein